MISSCSKIFKQSVKQNK
uniref:Uncharacterized protein n=1 Tax=Arundo donax TaxID=35708 RepID=A0A0A8Z659_ARUDO